MEEINNMEEINKIIKAVMLFNKDNYRVMDCWLTVHIYPFCITIIIIDSNPELRKIDYRFDTNNIEEVLQFIKNLTPASE